MKLCTTCKQEKELTSFWKNKSKKDGYCHSCIECIQLIRQSETNKISHKKSIDKQHRLHPEKYKAHNAVHHAIEHGKLIKQPCKVCGSLQVQAHHYLGYEEIHWLDVEWLCRKHHNS